MFSAQNSRGLTFSLALPSDPDQRHATSVSPYPDLQLERQIPPRLGGGAGGTGVPMAVTLPPSRYYSLPLIFSSANSTQEPCLRPKSRMIFFWI